MSFASAKLPFTFSEEKLLRDLARCATSIDNEHYNKQDYSGSWKVVSLRSPDGDAANGNALSFDGVFKDTPLLANCPYFEEVINNFSCEKASIRLLNLAAGSVIHEHSDIGLSYNEGWFRLHIPITTNPDVRFIIGGEEVVMLPGECWYGDFGMLHSVQNLGTTDRVHLIIDCKRNDWSDALFGDLGYSFEDDDAESYDADSMVRIIEALKLLDTPAAHERIEALKQQLRSLKSDTSKK